MQQTDKQSNKETGSNLSSQETTGRHMQDQGWANLLPGGPQWLVKFASVAGVGADGWSVLVSHLIGEKIFYVKCENLSINV